MTKVFIDGSSGTTGLQIHERLKSRTDLEILDIEEDKRKDTETRKKLMNSADVVFLCLPDAAAIEAVELIENPNTCVIDTSTAHRISDGWVYGFPEIGNTDKIRNSKRIANPGCHATGFISVVYPLTAGNLIANDAIISCYSLTGYSGGGKKMIADYESEGKAAALLSPALYGLGQNHKHIPEMKKICGLTAAPLFTPIVDNYYKGMATTVSLHASQLKNISGIEELRNAYAKFYEGSPFIHVASAEEVAAMPKIYANTKAGKDSLDIIVAGNDECITVTALFDNLGKGASGAAIENMNLVMGVDSASGLVL